MAVPNNGVVVYDKHGSAVPQSATKALGTISNLKSDTVELTETSVAIHVNSGGTIVGILKNNSTTESYTVVTGLNYKYEFKHIYESGTDATGIVFSDG